MTQQLEPCDNCQQMIPSSKISTHFGYCRRNVKKCLICHQFYDINCLEQHEEQFHKKEKCQHCKKEFPKEQFKKHNSNCHKKPKFCEYCQQNIPVQEYSIHLKACESRTKICQRCHKSVVNNTYLLHISHCTGPQQEVIEPQKNYQQYIQQQREKLTSIETVPKEQNSRKEFPRDTLFDQYKIKSQKVVQNRNEKEYVEINYEYKKDLGREKEKEREKEIERAKQKEQLRLQQIELEKERERLREKERQRQKIQRERQSLKSKEREKYKKQYLKNSERQQITSKNYKIPNQYPNPNSYLPSSSKNIQDISQKVHNNINNKFNRPTYLKTEAMKYVAQNKEIRQPQIINNYKNHIPTSNNNQLNQRKPPAQGTNLNEAQNHHYSRNIQANTQLNSHNQNLQPNYTSSKNINPPRSNPQNQIKYDRKVEPYVGPQRHRQHHQVPNHHRNYPHSTLEQQDLELQRVLMQSMGVKKQAYIPQQLRGMNLDQSFYRDLAHQDAYEDILKKYK